LAERATHAAVAKAQVTGGGADLADSALTLHGAIGYTWEHDLHLFYKRANLDRVLFGHAGSLERAHRSRSATGSRSARDTAPTTGGNGRAFLWSVH